jgi:hypothetical protein
MTQLITAGGFGFVLGFLVAFLWLRRVTRIAERAYQLATTEMRAMYEQRNDGSTSNG